MGGQLQGKHKVCHRCGKIVYTFYFFLVGMQTLLLLGMYIDITSLPGFPDHFPPTENREKSDISKMWRFWKILSEVPHPPTKLSFRNHKTMTQQIKTLRESYPNHIYGYMPHTLEFARFWKRCPIWKVAGNSFSKRESKWAETLEIWRHFADFRFRAARALHYNGSEKFFSSRIRYISGA